ncbi:MAG: Lrp/AsnC family transcriptional regulator [Anaerolineae bacterium]|nr:Lrp/AsnC family transcriptional regulator [Anaerolineae bacterium]
MTLERKPLDSVDWQILRLLQENARLTYAETGRQVGLSPPAVAERVHRLEEAGIIEGYHARLNPQKIGLAVMAFIRVNVPAEKYPPFIALAADLGEVLECHHVTGTEAFVLKVVVTSTAHLETVVGKLSRYGQTTTSIVMSSPLRQRILADSLRNETGAQ